MKTGELAALLDVSTSSIKTWAQEFGDFLSPRAQGGSQLHRFFDDQDARIMGHIADLRKQNVSWDDIRANLSRLEETNWQDLPDLPNAPPGVGPVPMMPTQAAETAIEQQQQLFLKELAWRDDRIDALEEELDSERAAHNETRQELTDQLITAKGELGELHGKLETVESERSKIESSFERERQLILRIAIIAGISVAILIAIVVLMALSGGLG